MLLWGLKIQETARFWSSFQLFAGLYAFLHCSRVQEDNAWSCGGFSMARTEISKERGKQGQAPLYRLGGSLDHDTRYIQIDYRQRVFFWAYRYRIALQEKFISITETDLWEFQQEISHYRYRFSLEFQLISITDTDFGLETN